MRVSFEVNGSDIVEVESAAHDEAMRFFGDVPYTLTINTNEVGWQILDGTRIRHYAGDVTAEAV